MKRFSKLIISKQTKTVPELVFRVQTASDKGLFAKSADLWYPNQLTSLGLFLLHFFTVNLCGI